MKILLLAVIFNLPLAVFAQTDCDSLNSLPEAYECFVKKLNAEDGKLNTNYKVLRSKLDSVGLKKLQKAQKSWIDFRDAECSFSTHSSLGSKFERYMNVRCLAIRTEMRAKELQQHISDN